eukprot:TRINITY_DN1834_c0_g1_i2.p1 TRINITY_DN1834_c0_g1~~TRINITY_DN1834_c0_g1_i2.p1  ORF type:complete len:283 (-),score=61.68 TRINITY_DN1834_c0_g1_i2:90-938(-)
MRAQTYLTDVPLPVPMPFCNPTKLLPDRALKIPYGPFPVATLTKLPPCPVPDASQCSYRCVFNGVDSGVTKALVEYAHSNKVTVQSLCTVAQIAGWSAVLLKHGVPFPHSHSAMIPCIFRKYLDPPIPDEAFCLASSPLVTPVTVASADTTLASLLQVCHAELERSLKEEKYWEFFSGLLSGKLANAPPTTLSVSSLGKLPVASHYACFDLYRLAVRTCKNGPVLATEDGFILHAYTYNGELHWTLSYTHPARPEEDMQLLSDTVKATLCRIALGDDGALGE